MNPADSAAALTRRPLSPMIMLPDLVRDSKLETRITHNGHTMHILPVASGQRGAIERERWRHVSLIGNGGGGVVWLEEKLGNSVARRAVKAIRIRVRDEPKSLNQLSIAKEYVRELEALAKFSQRKYSRCFVQFYGWWERTEPPHRFLCISMEYCPRGDLEGYISSQGPLREDEAKEIVAQVLDSLCYMHEEGFAHRDLKPANILIKSCPSDRWWVVICDHGVSKRVEDAAGVTTNVKGTPMFLSPERRGFHPDIVPTEADPYAADMWSLGETTFQVLCGQPTFCSDDTLRQFALGILNFPTKGLRNANVGDQAIEFVTFVMDPKPTRRLTCFQAREHAWMKVIEAQKRLSSEFDAHLLENLELDLDQNPPEQPLDAQIPDIASKIPSSIQDPIGALPDSSLNDPIPTKVNSAAKSLVDPTATVTQTAQDVPDRKIRWPVGHLDARKNLDTIGRLRVRSPSGNDGSSTTDMPGAPLERPRKNTRDNNKRTWNMNLKKLLRIGGSDESPVSQRVTPMSQSSQACPRYELLPGQESALNGDFGLGPTALPRRGPLTVGSVLVGEDRQSHAGAVEVSSPLGVAGPQPEELQSFKDYYSQDDIHPGDKVAVLWAYQPRADDEFVLDRGDMLKVMCIWNDGWATGVMINERFEEWEARCQAKRESGVSNTTGQVQLVARRA